MAIDFLLERFRAASEAPALVWGGRSVRYGWLADEVEAARDRLAALDVEPGSVVSLEADFSPRSVALLLALIERACVIVPLTASVEHRKADFCAIAEVEARIALDADDQVDVTATGARARHPILTDLRAQRHPGLVLFSSGSTGQSKAAVHDFLPLLDKFRTPRQCMRMMSFLLFDHIGGVNTLFYALSNAGTLVTTADRSPDAVCAAIAASRVELLPTSPTFLNLLLVSEAWRRHDLSSLRLVTYGTEVMPESTLRRIREILPEVKLQQTYGLSEVGILRSRSRSSDSLWVKVGGEDFETRVVDGLLEIKARSAMLGYLNAPSPFTDDGWFRTGDAVEQDGEWIRILGRRSELINVGGEKVYPAEVESVLQQMEGVEDASVTGVAHPITGQMVTVRVKLAAPEAPAEFRARMHRFCRGRLERWKVPQKVTIVTDGLHGDRFKKMRRLAGE